VSAAAASPKALSSRQTEKRRQRDGLSASSFCNVGRSSRLFDIIARPPSFPPSLPPFLTLGMEMSSSSPSWYRMWAYSRPEGSTQQSVILPDNEEKGKGMISKMYVYGPPPSLPSFLSPVQMLPPSCSFLFSSLTRTLLLAHTSCTYLHGPRAGQSSCG